MFFYCDRPAAKFVASPRSSVGSSCLWPENSLGTWPPWLGLLGSEGKEDGAVGLGAEEWAGAEGATGYPVSPGEALGPLEQTAGEED